MRSVPFLHSRLGLVSKDGLCAGRVFPPYVLSLIFKGQPQTWPPQPRIQGGDPATIKLQHHLGAESGCSASWCRQLPG